MRAVAEREPLIDHPVEIGRRLLRRHAVLQPPDEIEEVTAAARGERLRVDRQRQEDLDALVVQVEARRHDADDPGRRAVDLHDAPDDVFAAAEVAPPGRVGNDGDVLRADGGVGLVEQPAALRRDAQHVEQLRRHDGRVHPARTLGRAQVDRAGAVGADALERTVPFLELRPLRQGHPEAIEPEPRERAGDEHQPLGMGVAQRLEHHAVDDAEDRGVGADAQRERQNRHRGIPRALREGPEGIDNVLGQGLHKGEYH